MIANIFGSGHQDVEADLVRRRGRWWALWFCFHEEEIAGLHCLHISAERFGRGGCGGERRLTGEEPYTGNRRKLFHGAALAVVRSSRTVGALTLTADAPGLKGAAIQIAIAPVTASR